MAKAVALIVCILAFAGFAHCHDSLFNVEGKVYCDTCRVQFETRISENIPDAKVRLECRNRANGTVTYSIEAITDQNGQYSLPVKGDHELDICQVTVVQSPRSDCSEPMPGLESARVVCTDNSGLHTETRYANPLGFMIKNSLSNCKEVLNELGFLPLTQ